MIRPIAVVIRGLLLVAAVAAVAGTAYAQAPAPALRSNVTVTGDIVHIGDLVENSGPVADIPIFRAPDLGTTGVVSTERVVEAIAPHQLIDIDTRGLSEVIVSRASRAITLPEMSARIAQALSDREGLGDVHNISVTLDRDIRTLEVEPTAIGELQVTALAYDASSGRFDATVDLPTSAVLHGDQTHLTGTAIETVDTVAAVRPIARGSVLQASDLTTTRRPKSQSGDAIIDMAAAVGLAARHDLLPNQPLSAADLARPQVVQHGDTVTIVYQAPGLTLTLRGEAEQAGAIGDTIGVLNVESKRVIQCTVAGPGRVTVSSPITRIVENGPVVMGDAAPGAPPRSE